jgi:hypothetical protein
MTLNYQYDTGNLLPVKRLLGPFEWLGLVLTRRCLHDVITRMGVHRRCCTCDMCGLTLVYLSGARPCMPCWNCGCCGSSRQCIQVVLSNKK